MRLRRTDVVPSEKRSEIMRAVKAQGNKVTELVFVRLLRENKISGWRRGRPIFGKPDFVFPKWKLVIFVDGCFWHGCQKHIRMPKSNRAYWQFKIASNIRRDRLVNRLLRRNGWQIIRIWEHDLSRKNQPRLVSRIKKVLTKHSGR